MFESVLLGRSVRDMQSERHSESQSNIARSQRGSIRDINRESNQSRAAVDEDDQSLKKEEESPTDVQTNEPVDTMNLEAMSITVVPTQQEEAMDERPPTNVRNN